jgi:hypothetical protein
MREKKLPPAVERLLAVLARIKVKAGEAKATGLGYPRVP